jgi:hypothetical protein
VVDAMGVTDAGIFGDILCARMAEARRRRLVTDGVVRDVAGVLGTGLPVWCQGAAAPPSVAGLTFVDWQEPIGCGGVAVFPNDVVVVDDDGAVLIPQALVDEVDTEAWPSEVEQETRWKKLDHGRGSPSRARCRCRASTRPNAETKARYVTGANAHPLYRWAAAQTGTLGTPSWNFHKILIGRDGRVIDWFTAVSGTGPKLERAIEAALAAKG